MEKIEKLEGSYDVPQLKQKLNEIIDYLNTQPQAEDCTHSFDLNNRCSKCGVRGVKDMIAELQDTPEGWEKEFELPDEIMRYRALKLDSKWLLENMTAFIDRYGLEEFNKVISKLTTK